MGFSIRFRLSLAALARALERAFAQSENLRVGFLTVRTGPLAAGWPACGEDEVDLAAGEGEVALLQEQV